MIELLSSMIIVYVDKKNREYLQLKESTRFLLFPSLLQTVISNKNSGELYETIMMEEKREPILSDAFFSDDNQYYYAAKGNTVSGLFLYLTNLSAICFFFNPCQKKAQNCINVFISSNGRSRENAYILSICSSFQSRQGVLWVCCVFNGIEQLLNVNNIFRLLSLKVRKKGVKVQEE